MPTTHPTTRPALALLAAIASLGPATPRLFADGPGAPNLTYTAAQLHKSLSSFTAANGAPQGHGFVTMHRGYLVVIGAKDGGGGENSGSLSLFDISNPSSPVCVFTTAGNPNYASGTSHYAGNFREAHSIAFSGDYMAVACSEGGENGIQIWKLETVDKPSGSAFNNWFGPRKIAYLQLPNIFGGDYDGAVWSLTWAGRYIYAAIPSKGMHIIDTNNIEAPVLANRGAGVANLVPVSQIGGSQNGMHQIVALGNRITQGRQNFTFIDISDPLNPVLKDQDSTKPGYSAQRYGDKAFGFAEAALNTYDISNINDITKLAVTTVTGYNGGYGFVQDGVLHYGGGGAVIKVNISGNPPYNNFTVITPNKPPGQEQQHTLFSGADWDFSTPIGNLIFAANDHATGSALMVHQTAPDTTGPSVVAVSPKNNSTNNAVTTPIGIQLSDQIDGRTVNSTNFTIRKSGTTTALAGRYTHSLGIINFTPASPLEANTTYEIIVKAAGLKDFVGNTHGTQFTSAFSTGSSVVNPVTPLSATLDFEAPVTAGTAVTFSVTTAGGEGTVDVLWNFGDGTTQDTNTATSVSKTYANPGHYNVAVTVTRGGTSVTSSQVFTVHNPLTTGKPVHTSTIIYDDAATDKVWAVNTDAGTLAAINPTTGAKLHEVASGSHPRTVAKAPDGTIWVANEGSDNITVHSASNGAVTATIALPRGSAPFGILFSPDGANAYVSLGGSWEVAKINPSTRVVSTPVWVGAYPRGMAMTANSARLFVTRFLSTDAGGSLYEINPSTLAAVRTLSLAKDTTPDTEENGRGVPNHLISPVISPDGTALAIPSTKANIDRGTARDGVALDFDNTVRTITSFINLSANNEFTARRVDLNDRDSAVAAAYSPLGDYLFVVTQGSNSVEVLDAYTGEVRTSILNQGLAPRGIALSPDGTKAYVQNFMGRSIRVLNTTDVVQKNIFNVSTVATTNVVAAEPLSATVLKGKQIFYNAADPRMSQDKYLSCATCHTDAGHDARTWDFTNRGEGFRNTIDLNGRSGMGHGLVHWTANFDEIQDFENDIRAHQGGTGFLTNADFTATENPLGATKAGRNPDLDALAAYVASLDTVGKSPFRDEDGTLSAAGEAGLAVFNAKNCIECHIPSQDYRDGLSHNVGTLKTTSGQRLGAALTGIDTPTLIGLWNSAPYLHDGSAVDLQATFNGNHGGSLSTAEKNSLAAYLLEIEDGTTPPVTGGGGFVQISGRLVMEAENATAIQAGTGTAWVEVVATDASGDAAMSTPNTPTATTTYTTNASSALKFDANFTSTGNHYLWVRARGLAAGGADNSINYSLDNGALTSLNTANSTTWTWTKSGTAINVSSAALHTLRIHVRENGTQIDKVILTTDNAFTPSGEGDPETLGTGPAVPAIPTNVSAAATSSTAVTVTYTDASTDETGFDIEYKLNTASTWTAATDGTSSSGTGTVKTASIGSLTANTAYNFRVRSYNANGPSDWVTVNTSTPAAVTTLVFEAESLTHTQSDTVTSYNEAPASAGSYDVMASNAVGDYVEYTVNVPTNGTYTVSVRYKAMTSRGIAQLKIDTTPQGSAFDQRSSGFLTVNLGPKVLTAGPRTFRFEVTGTSGTGYGLSVDSITLTP